MRPMIECADKARDAGTSSLVRGEVTRLEALGGLVSRVRVNIRTVAAIDSTNRVRHVVAEADLVDIIAFVTGRVKNVL